MTSRPILDFLDNFARTRFFALFKYTDLCRPLSVLWGTSLSGSNGDLYIYILMFMNCTLERTTNFESLPKNVLKNISNHFGHHDLGHAVALRRPHGTRNHVRVPWWKTVDQSSVCSSEFHRKIDAWNITYDSEPLTDGLVTIVEPIVVYLW